LEDASKLPTKRITVVIPGGGSHNKPKHAELRSVSFFVGRAYASKLPTQGLLP